MDVNLYVVIVLQKNALLLHGKTVWKQMIFYFSGTGNTRWVAENLARVTGERLLFIPDELAGGDGKEKSACLYALSEGERVGFCFPVHGWQPPAIVRRFLSKLMIENAEGHYVYAVCTCGDNIGEAMAIFERCLPESMQLASCFSVIMPESYVCLPFMYTDTKEREREKIVDAGKRMEIISEIVLNRCSGISMLTKGATPRLYSYVIGQYFNKRMITDKPFTVDADACISCGRCEQVCPVGNIDLSGGYPAWKHDGSCTCCLACYHHCPKHAINYGKITRKRGQYYFQNL